MNEQVVDLVAEWLEHQDGGDPVPIEVLCNECPQLVPEVRQSVRRLRLFNELVHSVGAPKGPDPLPKSPVTATTVFADLRLHAAGGYGVVYRVYDRALGREVALKILKAAESEDELGREQFLYEAKVTGQLSHPGIPPIYGVGADADGRPCYAMRMIEGTAYSEAIDSFHRSHRRADQNDVAYNRLLRQLVFVCKTVAYAHRHGFLHCDLKPSNVRTGHDGGEDFGETVVVDWGLVRRKDPAPSIVKVSGGTKGYRSPEQARGEWNRLNAATDIYGLGAILFHVLTGNPPPDALDRCAGEEALTRPRDRHVDPALWAVCKKAMELEPSNRYETALELAAEIERYLADERVLAYGEPWTRRARRWVKVHRTAVASSLAAVAMGVIGLAILLGVVVVSNQRLGALNRNLSESNRREQTSRRSAQRRADLALRSIENYHSGVAASELLKQVELASLRKKLLEAPLAFYQELRNDIQESGDADVKSLDNLAMAYIGLASLTREVGSKEQALQSFEKARDVLEKLGRLEPGGLRLDVELARTYDHMGSAQIALGRLADAMKSYRRAIEMSESLLRDHPKDAAIQRTLAATCNNLANMLGGANREREKLRFYERSLNLFESVIRDDRGDMPAHEGLAAAYVNIGNLHRAAGRIAEAIAAHEKSRDVIEAGLRESPASVKFRELLATTYSNLGNLLSEISRVDEGMACYNEAVAVGEKLVRDNPAFSSYRGGLARAYNNMGLLQHNLRRKAEAIRTYERAVELLAPLVESHPDDVGYGRDLAQLYNNLAIVQGEIGQTDRAIKSHRHARERAMALTSAYPSVVEFRTLLARICNSLGVLYTTIRHPADAMEYYEQARGLLEPVIRGDPSSLEMHSLLGGVLSNLGNTLVDLRQPKAAIDRLNDAIGHQRFALSRAPRVSLYRQYLSNHYLNLGRAQRALGLAAEAAQSAKERALLWPHDGDQLYDVACELALCVPLVGAGKSELSQQERVQHQEYANLAMDALRQARAAGYRDIRHMLVDEDLDALRMRADFQDLVLELMDASFPGEPFAK